MSAGTNLDTTSVEIVQAEPAKRSGGREAAIGVAKGPTRFGWVAAGHVCVALGVVGAMLPLMPTTVFIIGAAACYARGSQRFYERLLAHRVFGPIVLDWRERGGMSAAAKRWAIGAIVVTISASMVALDSWTVRIVLALVAVILIAGLLRVSTVTPG